MLARWTARRAPYPRRLAPDVAFPGAGGRRLRHASTSPARLTAAPRRTTFPAMTSPARLRQPAFPPAVIFAAPVVWAFWLLLIFILIYPRGMLPPDQQSGPLGLAILAFQCLLCAIIVCFSRIRISQALGLPGILIISAFLSYLSIGFAVSFATGADIRVDIGYFLRRSTFFFPALLGTAFGAGAILVRMETDVLLRNVLMLMIAACVVIVVTSILALHELAGSILLLSGFTGYHNRFLGFHPSPNDTAMIGCATFVLALSFLSKPKTRPLAYIGLTVGFLTVFGTLSKTGILTLIVALLFILVFMGKRRRVAAITWIGLLSVLLFVVGNVFGLRNIFEDALQQDRIRQIFLLFTQGNIDNTLLTGRGKLWIMGLQLALESPLYGNGIGHLKQMEWEVFAGARAIGVHNLYLLVFGEAGIIPLSLSIMYVISLVCLWRFIPNSMARGTVIGLTIIIVAFSSSGDNLFDNWNLGFFSGLVCALGASAKTSASMASPRPRP